MTQSPEPNYQPPVCKHLRTKRFYIYGNVPETWDPAHTSAPSIWCLQTMNALGPDERDVTLMACRAGRKCYEDWIEEE